jgi:hypothetical protein
MLMYQKCSNILKYIEVLVQRIISVVANLI